ncbi:hypothetical protein COOONC_06083 [Cooperia oncophora]
MNHPTRKRIFEPTDYYTDVRKFTDWICLISGVCPGQPRQKRPQEQKRTTMYGVHLVHDTGFASYSDIQILIENHQNVSINQAKAKSLVEH